MKTVDNINYEADKGMVFIRKADNLIVGFGIGLGSKDSIYNYEEIECSQEFKGVIGYDNTIDDKE